jgi:predicted RNase H-like HicB family nuclease/predicted RNA binding protein YcfA (HicA-like mRNA interferase family)
MIDRIEVEREEDGCWIAEVLELPGAMAYGPTRDETVARAKALALRAVAERKIEHGEAGPNLESIAFGPRDGLPSTRAGAVLAAHERLGCVGWTTKRQSGSHRTLERPGWPDCVCAFHDREEIGPRMLARIAKHTGLRPRISEREGQLTRCCSRWRACEQLR